MPLPLPRDCTTCSLSQVQPGTELLVCTHPEVTLDGSFVQDWRAGQADLDALGWPEGPSLAPCPCWAAAWGDEEAA